MHAQVKLALFVMRFKTPGGLIRVIRVSCKTHDWCKFGGEKSACFNMLVAGLESWRFHPMGPLTRDSIIVWRLWDR